VIFTPEALETLVSNVVYALAGVSLMRKTTPFADRLGSQIAAPSFSVLHRPNELAGAPAFDGEGFLNRDLDIVRDGVLENFVVDWYFSRKLDRPMTTGAVNLTIAPGDRFLDDIIAGTERGIVLGYYSGGTPNQNLDFSGVAKNSFYVEDGKIVHPITETMVAGNFASVLESIKAISSETLDFGDARFPWVASSGITISTK
jgi:PmbA protein